VKYFLISIFALGAFWDFATSFLGIVGLFGVTQLSLSNFDSVTKSLGVLITALIGSLIILGLSLNTEDIWDQSADSTYKTLRPIHIVGIFFDAFSSYLGTAQNV
jgi:divalent metal cation (Fe/Co/Zn/Cd) transporter